MRVIEEQCPFSDVAMVKNKKKTGKKTARQHNNYHSDERDSDSGVRKKGCSHVSKSVNIASVRKAIKASTTIQCAGCVNDGVVAEEINACADITVWFCLQCGYQGCGRSTKSQHGLKHWKQPRSDSHHIALNTTTEMIWCYECDDEITGSNNSLLKDTVAHVMKNMGVPRHVQSRPNSSENGTEASALTSTVSKGAGTISKSGPKLKGLSNLGNTCFFNAVIQSLSQVSELNHLLNDLRKNEITLTLPGYTDGQQSFGSDYDDSDGDDAKPSHLAPISVQLGKDCMTLTDSLVKLFKEMTPDDGPRKPLNPRGLFDQICKKVPRFKGYQQQDSHELLRNLLDALKTEELTRVKSGIKAKFNWKNLSEYERKSTMPEVKCYGQQAKHTSVDSLFGGYLLSTVLCGECGKASQIFEPFLDLSLPIHEERSKHTARRGSKSVADDFTPTEERHEPSKHQLKKAAKNAKKNRKGRNSERTQSVTIEEDNVVPSTPAGTVESETKDSNAASAPDSELASVNDANIPPDSLSSSRSHTPKSELGYNSDSEDSTDPSANGLATSLEKLSLTETTSLERPSSARIKDSVDMSLKPLADRLDCAPLVCSVLSSLGQFTYPELLTGSNKFACSFCNRKAKKRASASNEKAKTVYTDARKQLLIYSPPAILTLHLKRFQQNGYSFSKVNRHVEFSICLDLAPYCSSLSQGIEPEQTSVKYVLFAVVEHSGRLNSGHYTAYVRQRTTEALHKTMLQKPLYGQKPLTVLLERMSILQKQIETRESTDSRAELDGAAAVNGEGANNHSRWYHISDTHVKEVSEAAVLNSQAYLLFYERVR